MNAWLPVVLLSVGLGSAPVRAGPDSVGLGSGRDGPLVVTGAAQVINHYAQVTGPAAPGDDVLLVADTKAFSAGELVLVLQATGLVPEPSPGSRKPLSVPDDSVGQWEFARLARVGEGMLSLSEPLVHSYAAEVTQIIRVPEYTQVQVQKGASLRAVPWNGRTGGVLAFLATGPLHNEGEISATGAGFRGGSHVPDLFSPMSCKELVVASRPGAQKGEGVAVTQFGPTKTGRESVSNGGGGGVCPLAGGGGGGNGGPGGRGGGSTGLDEDGLELGGQGGSKLVYSLPAFLGFGGGGGGGHGSDWSVSRGGAGGGIVVARAQALTGAGSITADGESGDAASTGGAGGGGAGGGISLRFSDSAECGVISARGGDGGAGGTQFTGRGGAGGGGGGGRVVLLADSHWRCPLLVDAGLAGAAMAPAVIHANQNAQPIQDERASLAGVVIDSLLDPPPSCPSPGETFKIITPKDGARVNTSQGMVVTGRAPVGFQMVLDFNGPATDPAVSSNSSGIWTIPLSRVPISGGTEAFVEGMSYTFSARAVAFQNCQTSSVTFTVDTQAPSVYFDSAAAPKTPSNLEIVNFKFSTTDTASTGFKEFQCSLDGAPFVKCNSDDPFTISGDKQHVFKLRAMDEAGNINEMQPPYTWTTDFTKPGVRFDNPALPNARTNVQDFAFAFSSTAQDWKEFQCADERDGNYSTCASGTGRHFDDGSRTFCVKAVDHAGNIGEPACHTWFVDTVRPRVVLDLSPGKTPRNPTNKESASFEFSSPDDDVGKFQCALNGNSEQSFRDCNSHDSYPIVQEGIQTFYVRVVDAAGNVSEPPASYSWNVDLTEPIIAINREPKPRSTTRDAEFAFSSEPGAVFECALEDSGGLSFTSCHSPCRFSVGTDGIQKFYVKAIDLAGNEVLVNREWEVDTQLPEVLVTEPSREALTRAKLPFFRGQTERNSIVHIWVDGKEYGLTPSGPSGDWYFFPRDEALSLAEGRHTVSASAIDSFGNTGNFSESVVFFIDSIPPDTNIVTYPPKAHRSYKSDFSFSSTEEGVEYECQIDAGKFLPCGKNHSFDSLAVGQHTLAVAAKDKAGNVDPNPATYVWSIYFERPLYPDISEPADGARVETGTPTISGKTVPNGTVIIFIDGEPSEKTASADGNGLWTFQPPARLAPGRHSLSGETRDVDGTPSESRSPEIFFTVVIPSEVNQAIGGGLGGCSSSGTAGSSSFFWGLFALIVFRRRCRS